MDTVDLLGLLGAAGLILFYLPQLWTLWRTPRVVGFNIYAWVALLVGVSALMLQLVYLQAWTGVTANAIAVLAIVASIVLMRRKS